MKKNTTKGLTMKKTLSFIGLLFLVGCSTTTVRFSDQMPPIEPNHSGRNDFFIAGVGQEKIIDANDYCKHGINTVKTKYTFMDGLLSTVTFGIYTPNSYEIYCNRRER